MLKVAIQDNTSLENKNTHTKSGMYVFVVVTEPLCVLYGYINIWEQNSFSMIFPNHYPLLLKEEENTYVHSIIILCVITSTQ